jgi:TPR repeat protein
MRLLRRAATLGDADAQYRLGDLYFRGGTVQQNNFQAYVWLNAAARGGNAAASAAQEKVAALLQPVEIEQAGKLAARLAQGGR